MKLVKGSGIHFKGVNNSNGIYRADYHFVKIWKSLMNKSVENNTYEDHTTV